MASIRFASTLRYGAACLLTTGGLLLLANVGRAQGQTSLPLPPPFARSEEETLEALMLPLAMQEPDTRLVLARVVALKTIPISQEHGKVRQYPVGGRLRVMETLLGSPPGEILLDVEDEKPAPPKNGIGLGISHYRPVFHGLELGRYLIVKLKAGRPDVKYSDYNPVTFLNGLNDPVLAQFRRRLAWKVMPDQQQAHQEEEAALFDPKASVPARYAAFRSRWADAGRNYILPNETPDVLANRHIHNKLLVRLLGQMRLPHPLRVLAINHILADLSKPLQPGSEEAMLARYLLHTLARCPDTEIARKANEQMHSLIGNVNRDKTVFPDYVQALKERLGDGNVGEHRWYAEFLEKYMPSRETLPKMQDRFHPVRPAPPVPLLIPAFGATERERSLKMAAVTV